MADYVDARVGDRMYRVYGLEDRETAIRSASQIRTLIEGRMDAAEAALEGWRGPHAVSFADRVNGEVLTMMIDLRWALLRAAERCRTFPDEPYVSVFAYGDEYMSARVEAVDHDTQAEAGADTETLRAFQDAGTANDGQLWSLAAEVTIEGLTAEVADRLGPT